MQAKIETLSRGMGGELLVTLSMPPNHIDEVAKLKDEVLDVELKKHRERRSKDANSLMWCICREIGAALNIPDREVYRKAIKDIGVYDIVPIQVERIDALKRHWSGHGIGWFIEVEDNESKKLPGFKRVRMYYGSSTYNSKELSALIDYLQDDAQQIGITLQASKEQIEEAKRRWGEDA